jgi:transposase
MAMDKRITRKSDILKNKKFTKRDRLYVGLDVHKVSHHVAFWLNGRIVKTCVIPADNIKVLEILKPYRIALRKVVYEAGPTGFHLARFLQQCKIPVEVIAPSEVPEKRNSKAKSDRLDCKKLATYSAKGLLKSVGIPTAKQESDRQLSRFRDQLIAKRKRVKQQIKSMLLEYGIEEPEGLINFSNAGIAELKNMDLCNQLRFCIDSLIDELSYFETKLKETKKQMASLFKEPENKKAFDIVHSHPGIGEITGRQFILELHDPQRFTKPTEIASYLGLCPKVNQSGKKRKDGNVVMTSRATLRANLIESSWAWIRKDEYAKATFIRLLRNTGEAKKAIVAMARRLAIHLWKMLCKQEVFRVAA